MKQHNVGPESQIPSELRTAACLPQTFLFLFQQLCAVKPERRSHTQCFQAASGPLLRIAYTLRMKFTKQGGKPRVREREENAIKSKKCESIASFTVTALHIQAVTMSSFETYCICCL